MGGATHRTTLWFLPPLIAHAEVYRGLEMLSSKIVREMQNIFTPRYNASRQKDFSKVLYAQYLHPGEIEQSDPVPGVDLWRTGAIVLKRRTGLVLRQLTHILGEGEH